MLHVTSGQACSGKDDEGTGDAGGDDGDQGPWPASHQIAGGGAERQHVCAGSNTGKCEGRAILLGCYCAALFHQFPMEQGHCRVAAAEREIAGAEEYFRKFGKCDDGHLVGLLSS